MGIPRVMRPVNPHEVTDLDPLGQGGTSSSQTLQRPETNITRSFLNLGYAMTSQSKAGPENLRSPVGAPLSDTGKACEIEKSCSELGDLPGGRHPESEAGATQKRGPRAARGGT
jgi:hypothetical protein